MKVLFVMLWLFFLTGDCLSQTPPVSPDSQNVMVVQKQWSLQVRNPLLDEDPLQAINETQQAIRDRKETLRQESIRARQGLPPETRSVRVKTPEAGNPESPTAAYLYEAKFKNNGGKAIQILVWDYVFFDRETEAEVGRLRFESKASISPGKTKLVIMRSVTPPTRSINAAQADKKPRDRFIEQVIIQEIQYADGSVWKSPLMQAN